MECRFLGNKYLCQFFDSTFQISSKMLSFLWDTNENVGTTTRTRGLRNQVLIEPRSNHAQEIKNHVS